MITNEFNDKDNKNISSDDISVIHNEKKQTSAIVNADAVISTGKKDRAAEYKKVLFELQTDYPITFPSDETKLVPLKIGIRKDIITNTSLMNKLSVSKKSVHKFLKTYTKSNSYLSKHLAGTPRYDLTGMQVGEVGKEQEVTAKERMKIAAEEKMDIT